MTFRSNLICLSFLLTTTAQNVSDRLAGDVSPTYLSVKRPPMPLFSMVTKTDACQGTVAIQAGKGKLQQREQMLLTTVSMISVTNKGRRTPGILPSGRHTMEMWTGL